MGNWLMCILSVLIVSTRVGIAKVLGSNLECVAPSPAPSEGAMKRVGTL